MCYSLYNNGIYQFLTNLEFDGNLNNFQIGANLVHAYLDYEGTIKDGYIW